MVGPCARQPVASACPERAEGVLPTLSQWTVRGLESSILEATLKEHWLTMCHSSPAQLCGCPHLEWDGSEFALS